MGKYPKSRVNDKYSDWHYQVLGKKFGGTSCYLTDVDRLWVEVRPKDGKLKLVAITDIKEPYNKVTPTEKAVYDWFETVDMPVYIVFTTEELGWFNVQRWTTKEIKKCNEEEYVQWIKSL